jgi:hypothetical protein
MSDAAFTNVTDIATRRRSDEVLSTITIVLGGVQYGTFPVAAPYVAAKPIVLYVVPQSGAWAGDELAGPLDCLITDDVALAAEVDVAR